MRSMKANFEQSGGAKILAFRQEAPKPKMDHSTDMSVLFSQNKENSHRRFRKVMRHIPQTPDRILDAPELRPDFYLNLLERPSENTTTVALSQTVYPWGAGTGSINELCTLPNADDYVSSVSWVGDGSYLSVGTSDSKVQVWDVARETCVRTMNNGDGRVAAMDWNKHVLSAGTRSGDIFNHDVRIREHHCQTMSGHSQEICGLKWSPDGKYLASGGNDNIVNVWNEAGQQKCSPLIEHTAAVKALAWCPWQSNVLASGGGTADRSIKFWNVNTAAASTGSTPSRRSHRCSGPRSTRRSSRATATQRTSSRSGLTPHSTR